MKTVIRNLLTLCSVIIASFVSVLAEDGYDLWLRYQLIQNKEVLTEYQNTIQYLVANGDDSRIKSATEELVRGIKGLTGKEIEIKQEWKTSGAVVLTIPSFNSVELSPEIKEKLKQAGEEGFLLYSFQTKEKQCILIAANSGKGILYGSFHLLRLMQTSTSLKNLDILSIPKAKYRILDHWDNLDRTVERGYAGFSIWDWHKLPDYCSPQYKDYARANASLGINGVVLTNVNANALILTPQYLQKVAAIADVMRPYGIRVFLTARFNAPMILDNFKTADPKNEEVMDWWKNKATEIYKYIPDFGGFLVKANSEGQPGPQNYNRTHAEGANLLADALAPYGGIVMWRAFVYSNEMPEDRAKQAYNEFVPLDSLFHDNVLIQVKNGAIDFQPREPFHPLFGATRKTPVMMEFQITQEYLGFATHLVYLAPLYKECLYSDTWAKGKGSYVANILDGSVFDYNNTAFAGVSNIGTDRNWTGHPFGQANWYAFGRLAWDHSLSSEAIAEEWIRMTFTNSDEDVKNILEIMLASREIAVSYMTPLGLHHMMGWDNHYGPGPWINEGRADWTAVYYHKADSQGIGFDRTASGSNAISQYYPPVQKMFSDPATCPDKYLLWFHHLDWDYTMKSGNTLWDELCYKYYHGADSAGWMIDKWQLLKNTIDKERFDMVNSFLHIQQKEAIWWRNACILYFQSVSKRPLPKDLGIPEGTLEYYMNLRFPYAPGIRPTY